MRRADSIHDERAKIALVEQFAQQLRRDSATGTFFPERQLPRHKMMIEQAIVDLLKRPQQQIEAIEQLVGLLLATARYRDIEAPLPGIAVALDRDGFDSPIVAEILRHSAAFELDIDRLGKELGAIGFGGALVSVLRASHARTMEARYGSPQPAPPEEEEVWLAEIDELHLRIRDLPLPDAVLEALIFVRRSFSMPTKFRAAEILIPFYPKQEVISAIARTHAMLDEAGRYGDMAGPAALPNEIARLRGLHPGFSDKSYDSAHYQARYENR